MLAHTGLALATKTPELELDKEESDLLADASTKLLAEFDLEPDPKTQAIIGFIIACGSIYGPRVAIVAMRKKKEKKDDEAGKASVYNPNGTYAGQTTFSDVEQASEPVKNAGTV